MRQSVCGQTDGTGVSALRNVLVRGWAGRGIGSTVSRDEEVT